MTELFFHKGKFYKDGSRNQCKECVSLLGKQYRKENKIAISKTHKKRNDANKITISVHNKEYYESNKESVSLLKKVYKQNHRDEFIMYDQNRRARIKKLPCTLTVAQWNKAKEYFNNRCCYCGEEKLLAQEHFIAIGNSGEYGASNILPACKSCNSSKGIKDFASWYPLFKHYSKQREQKIFKYLNYRNEIQQFSLAF